MAFDLRFTKGQGTGNDFVLYRDTEGERPLTAAEVAAVCDRRYGVGGDGVIRAVRTVRVSDAPADTTSCEWFMDYWNADGSVAEMCGNGIRVYVAYLIDQGLLTLAVDDTVQVGTRAGVRAVTRTTTGYRVDLGRFVIDETDGTEVSVQARPLNVPRPGLRVSVGNPHVVVALPDEEALVVLDLTDPPRLVPPPADGANVEFVVPADPLVEHGVGSFRMRVHERGSGETLSCGTGAAAAALAIRFWAGAGAPDRWRVRLAGGALGVTVESADDGEHVHLTGPAHLVYDGVLRLA